MTQTPAAIVEREAALLAPYAMHSVDSRGRRYDESAHPYRGPYQRDRDRIVHCSAFRRLAHKTQVFTGEMGDYHRTRLTHTLEVASIARTVGRALRLNEDLIEALALMHDIGHPPFGHAGEDVLDQRTAGDGGFNHNRQAIRIVQFIETRYPNFPGLNVSLEMLQGQQTRVNESPAGRLLEVQVVDAADSIAYDAHDADDAVEIGLLKAAELDEADLWRTAGRRVRQRYIALDDDQFRRATVHAVIDELASDLIESTRQRLETRALTSAEEIVQSGERLAAPSARVAEAKSLMEKFLFERVYRHPDLLSRRVQASAVLQELFDAYVNHPELLPAKFRQILLADGPRRAAADYVSGMTDRFAWDEHQRLVGHGGTIGARNPAC